MAKNLSKTNQIVDKGNWKTNTAPLVLVVLVAIAIRLHALQATAIINPDGPLYIHQAQALSQGDWQDTLHSLSFLSSYSLLISFFHLVFQDWLTSARAVSLVFGTLAIIPLHGMLRQFFPREESLATTATLAFLPTWVINSIDIVRDPVAWFFALYGLYWLARGLQERNKIFLSLSNLAFILAAWARIEVLVYPATCLLLPLISKRYRDTTILWFFLPIVIGAMIFILSPIRDKELILNASRLSDFVRTVSTGVPQYNELRNMLVTLRSPEQGNLLFCFLAESRRFIWLIGLGTIANRLFEAMSYPFTLIALSSIGTFVNRKKERSLAIFFCLLAASSFTLLWTRTFQTWIIEYRYMMLVILPGSLFLCAGITSLTNWIGKRLRIPHLTALTGIALLLILSTLPKNLQTRGDSEIALKEIGQFLDNYHPAGHQIKVAASCNTIQVVNFYANQNRPIAHPLNLGELMYPAVFDSSLGKLITILQKKKIDYLLWEENNRPKDWPLSLEEEKNLEEIGRWHNHQTGTIILYRLDEKKN